MLELLKTGHPLLIEIQDNILHEIDVDQRDFFNYFFLMWVPGLLDFRENEAPDKAANEALDKEPTDDLMPVLDVNPLTAKCIYQVWQKEWEESVIIQ